MSYMVVICRAYGVKQVGKTFLDLFIVQFGMAFYGLTIVTYPNYLTIVADVIIMADFAIIVL